MVLDAIAGQTTAEAPGPGQTLRGYDFDGINYWGAVSTALGAASVTMSWSKIYGILHDFSHAAIDIPTATPVTLTMATLSAPAISYGTDGSITVTVHSNGGTPTGDVSLSVDNGAPLTQALSGGQTVFTIPGLHAGDHNLSASYAGEGNYWVSSATDKLTVNPATLTASILGTPTKTYDGAISATLTSSNYSLSGLVGTDSFTVTKTTGSYNSKDVATATTVSTPLAGTDFTAGAGTRASDYTLQTTATGPGAITPRPLTITANSMSKAYGQTISFAGTEFSVGATTTTPPAGLVAGDAVSSVTLSGAGGAPSATVAAPGPNYPIIPSAAMGSGLSNYLIKYVNGTLTVNPATLTITAKGESKTYGTTFTPDGTNQCTSSGLVNGDAVTSVTLTSNGYAARATVAGSPYTVTPSTAVGHGLANYSISYVNGTLLVNPAPLTVTATNQTKIQGEANPTFTASYSAFVLGEGPSVLGGTLTCSTTATKSSPPGTYAITPADLTSSNYAITFVSGTLTVISYSQAMTNLQAQVDGAGLPQGTQNSLDSKLQAALALFTQGDTTAAKSQLGAFINEVSAQSGKKIDAGLADALIAYAQRIINAVG
jgi:hypothetical protein